MPESNQAYKSKASQHSISTGTALPPIGKKPVIFQFILLPSGEIRSCESGGVTKPPDSGKA
jgi:hypothetical protein